MSNRLVDLRTQLDVIDEELIRILAKRFQVTHEIGLYKLEQKLQARDPSREDSKLQDIARQARLLGLEPDFAQSMMKLVMAEVVKNHKSLHDRKDIS